MVVVDVLVDVLVEVLVDVVVDELVGVFSRPASAIDPQGIVAVVYLCSLRTRDFHLQQHEVIDYGWFELDEVTDWHKTHETYARAAQELWLRWHAG